MTDRVQIGFGVLRDVERLDVSRTVPVGLPSLSEQNQRSLQSSDDRQSRS